MTTPSETPSDARRIHAMALRLAALAADGLVFTDNEYDIDRYRQVDTLARDLLALMSDHDADDIRLAMGLDDGYVTPKVDVRGCLFDDAGRVLLMREKADGCWSLPGGWADPGDTPSAAVEREMLEESGHVVRACELVSCLDREAQGHEPAMAVHVYKLFFLCEQTGPPRPASELETLDIGWFDVADLPELSRSRVLPHEIETALEHHRRRGRPAVFD